MADLNSKSIHKNSHEIIDEVRKLGFARERWCCIFSRSQMDFAPKTTDTKIATNGDESEPGHLKTGKSLRTIHINIEGATLLVTLSVQGCLPLHRA